MLFSLGLILLVAMQFDIFSQGKEAFAARLSNTGDLDAGVLGTAMNWTDRVFGDYIGALKLLFETPVLGYGLGYGTNAGAQWVTGSLGFLLAEGEWSRLVLESGPILGLATLILRVCYTLAVFFHARRSVLAGEVLPMLLFGACVLLLFSGQFGQGTTMGFAVLGGGLVLAAGEEDFQEIVPIDSQFEERLPVRARSAYAEYLHGTES